MTRSLGRILRHVALTNIQSKNAASALAASSTTLAPAVRPQDQSFNAFLLQDHRFGLTIDDIDRAVGAVLAAGTGLKFTTNFLLSDEIVIEAVSCPAHTPQSAEAKLKSYKRTLAQTVSRLGLAKGVSLCHVDPSLSITRREGDASTTGAGGWNAVASRGSWRKTSQPAAAPTTMAPRSLVALKRTDWRKKGKEILMAPVEDDWFEAAEKLEESGAGGQNGEDGKENQGNLAAKGGKYEEEVQGGQNGQCTGQGQAIVHHYEESNVAQGQRDGQIVQEPATARDGEDNSITQEVQQEGQVATMDPAEVVSAA